MPRMPRPGTRRGTRHAGLPGEDSHKQRRCTIFCFSSELPGPRESAAGHLSRPDNLLGHLGVQDPYVSTTVVSTALAPGQRGLLANPLARKPLPRSERASELGAAYRNRTDDLCITRGLLPRSDSVTCTDSTMDRTRSSDCTGIWQPPVPRPTVDRRLPPHYHADPAAPFPGMNAGQPSLGTTRTTCV